MENAKKRYSSQWLLTPPLANGIMRFGPYCGLHITQASIVMTGMALPGEISTLQVVAKEDNKYTLILTEGQRVQSMDVEGGLINRADLIAYMTRLIEFETHISSVTASKIWGALNGSPV